MMVIFRSIALLCLLAGAPALAQDGPASAARATQATHDLQAHLDGVRRAGHRPDYSAAPASALLRDVFDANRLSASPPPASVDIDWVTEWGIAANQANKQIMMFGMPAGPELDEAVLKRNLDDYEDQVTVAMDFMVRINARSLDTMALFLSELPKERVTKTRLEGFQLARSGGGDILQGVLNSAAHAAKPANARMLIAAVNDTQATWVQAVLPADRAKIVWLLKEIPRAISDRDVSREAGVLLAAFTAKP